MKKEIGVTLITIVITVIIMLILAGVVLSLITGEDGLFAQTDYSAQKYKTATQTEADRVSQLLDGEYGGENTGSSGGKYDITVVATDLSSRNEQTVNLTEFEGYENLNENNFLIINKSMQWVSGSDGEEAHEISKTYDSQTGILSLGKQKSYSSWGSIWTFYNIYDVYLVQPAII